jgi:hypothetical protein
MPTRARPPHLDELQQKLDQCRWHYNVERLHHSLREDMETGRTRVARPPSNR